MLNRLGHIWVGVGFKYLRTQLHLYQIHTIKELWITVINQLIPLWIIRITFLSPLLGFSITLVLIFVPSVFILPEFISSFYFLANSNLVFWFLLMMTGLHAVVWSLYFSSRYRFWMVVWEWILKAVDGLNDYWFWVFPHSSHNDSISNCSCFPWVTCSMTIAPDISSLLLFIFRILQIIVLTKLNNCPIALFDFLSFIGFKMACFFSIDSYLVFMLVSLFYQEMQCLHICLKAIVFILNCIMFK